MISQRSLKIIFFLIITFYFSYCKTEQFFLNGGLTGTVTDSLTGLPVSGASAILYPLHDSATTDNSGRFYFGNLEPGTYEAKVAKAFSYFAATKDTMVKEGETPELNFSLNGIPSPYFSTSYLDFGFDSTVKHFNISNKGEGILKFSMQPDYFIHENWIDIKPSSGEISKETTTIAVSINRDKIPIGEKQQFAWINLYDQFLKNYCIPVLVNGVVDKDLHYYSIVKIGTQTWLAENLNTGIFTDTRYNQLNNLISEKYCSDNIKDGCDYGGGLYTWNEMMEYSPSDNMSVGTTKGVCPAGWHIPTFKEWEILIDYYGGASIAGDSLKVKDPNVYWIPHVPSGIEAYGNPNFDGTQREFNYSNYATFYSSTEFSSDEAYYIDLHYDTPSVEYGIISKSAALSVRCVKN